MRRLTRWRLIRYGLTCCLLAAVLGVPRAAGAAGSLCEAQCVSTSGVVAGDTGFTAHGGRSGGVTVPGSGAGGARPAGGLGPLLQYRYQQACGEVCTTKVFRDATADCTGRGGDFYYILSRPVGTTEWSTGPEITCLLPAQLIGYDTGQLAAYVSSYFRNLPLPEPGLRLSPADNAVVNLPEIVSADEPVRTSWTIDVAPFPQIVLSAQVVWEWDFGDGTTLRTSGPGRPYDPRDPDGDYVSHTYLQAGDAYRVSVTAVWTGTYTVAGVAGQAAVDGTVERTSDVDLRAADYAGVLTGN